MRCRIRYTGTMEPSIFTHIINGEIPWHKIYEDDKVIAFLDVHPQTPGHTLLVPKQQIDELWDVDDDTYHYLWTVAKRLAPHIRDTMGTPRVSVVVMGFGIPHTHIHLIPTHSEDDVKRPQDLDSPIDHDRLATVAAKLRVDD